ncbi:hypothetical protein OLZ32_11250 [Rhizobium sp. 1AS11]|uniref:hypothetical protein n=1 Tax=Rhizobium acaciae TaxID=2989736 RepID=UPI00221FA52A|nr:hypothetical protein [Rhizobium acaciae]MCW1409064.1 hypothetical protein [Rhizobium acaciae]MCW1740981.1 hypothetical protein [Rhizobium acaciae]MCW1749254.1 hypothetical protein [Rhizobium acaciae]
MSIKLADWSSYLSFVGQRPMILWMAECRRQLSHVMGGWMDVSPSLVIGARSANLAIALVRYLGQFDLNQVETSGAAPMLGAKDWQGGSSSIIEAISIRASGSWCTSSAIPYPHQSLRGGAGRPAESF